MPESPTVSGEAGELQALLLAAALVALGLGSGIPTRAVAALDVLAVLSLAAGLAFIDGESGQDIPTLGAYPLPLWPPVALTAVSVTFTTRLVLMYAARATSTRQRTTLAALSTASALLIALMVYWLL